jgi:RHS repeat-associated protein
VITNLVSRRSASPVALATGFGRVIPARVRPQTSQTYYHRNQQYSIVGLTNTAGTLVERYTYSAYGTLGIYAANGTVRTSSTSANRYTYTDREWDGELRLYHFRARWYDPAPGGFVSRDPLGYVDGMSLYRGYFGVRGVDPDGTQWWLCPDGSTMWVPPSTSPVIIQSHRDRGCFPAGVTDETGKPTPYPTTDGRPAPFPKSNDPVLREFEDHEVKPDKDGNTREFCGGFPKTQSHKNPQFLCCKDKSYDRFTHCCKGGVVEAKKPLHERDFTSFDACHRWCMTGRDGPGISNNKQTRVTQFGGAVVGGYIFFYFIPIPGAGFVGAGCGKLVIDEILELHCDDICGRPGC